MSTLVEKVEAHIVRFDDRAMRLNPNVASLLAGVRSLGRTPALAISMKLNKPKQTNSELLL